MAQINVSNLTFCYEGNYDNVFENVSFSVDTDWKLGLIGRNGKGKTTFLNLLLGKYEYRGSITGGIMFDYFPYPVRAEDRDLNVIDVAEKINPDYELWKVCRELDLLEVDAEVLYRPYETLSHGERTKVMLALLFSRDNYFLLIDEPTNHLDAGTREVIKDYLNKKKGFILVSHDRSLLDACVDHVLVLERSQILVEKGNFSSWWENKQKQDQFELSENEKQKKEIRKLEASARRTAAWADQVEDTKIGYNPLKDTNRNISSRSYIGEKSRRMQQRRKNLERRQDHAMEEKTKLLKNLESPADLKLMPLSHHKEVYIRARDLSLSYGDKTVLSDFNMELKRGERIVIRGRNGSGKSSLIKAVLKTGRAEIRSGQLEVVSGLEISYINQDTSGLSGDLDAYIKKQNLDASLLKAILRQLDFERVQFEKTMEEYSEGQKKKVLIASSLLKPAHLYIWDEPLNYIDVFSRMQIEQLILKYRPTMLIVEHDQVFAEHIEARVIKL